MSQDIKRERELGGTGIRADGVHLYRGDTTIGMMVSTAWADQIVVASKDAKYYRELWTGQSEVTAEQSRKIYDLEAKLAEANEALEQARRDAGQGGVLAQVAEWLAKREATVATRASEAISPATTGFNDLGAIESRAAKLRRAQSDGKLLHELRLLLNGLEQPAVRYWVERYHDYDNLDEYYKLSDDGSPLFWYAEERKWLQSHNYRSADDLAKGADREITAAELPAGVTP